MLQPHAMIVETAQTMEIATVTAVSFQLIAQVTFLWIIQSLKYFLLNVLHWVVECDAALNCSGHGICGPEGACQCDPTYYGDNCTSKLRKRLPK